MLPMAVLAGGRATRLGALTKTMPKALLPVAGEPFIHHQLRLLKRNGINDAVICAGHLGEHIEAAVGNGAAFGLHVRYSHDGPELLGTGGALRNALPLLGERFMVVYGDSYLDTDYPAVEAAFLNSGMNALMTVYRNEEKYDAGNVVYENGRVMVYDKCKKIPGMLWIDYGLGCFHANSIQEWHEKRFDLADLYAKLSHIGELAGYEVLTRFYEIGSKCGLSELNAMMQK
jgi:NDP-sugar pyrophosphorylase family protein